MTTLKRISCSFLLLQLLLISCKTVPITGRKQLSIIPSSTMQQLSEEGYRQQISSTPLSSNKSETERVKRVGRKIISAVEKYLQQEGQSNRIAGFNWEINLLESKEANAFCMEGGKIAFYTGIMKYCPSDDAIAVVMGHEIAHAIAHHGGERMSQMLVTQAGGMTLNLAMRNQSSLVRNLTLASYGVGSQVGVLLPFSRTHETEADRMGLIFMKMAGYNPHEAARFWERMAAGSKGSPPKWLSTHPDHQTRIENLKKWANE
jgi:predicted Zn-dependent protease